MKRWSPEEFQGPSREDEEENTVYEGTDHDAVPLRKSRHRTMMNTQSAIRFGFGAPEPKPLIARGGFNHPTFS